MFLHVLGVRLSLQKVPADSDLFFFNFFFKSWGISSFCDMGKTISCSALVGCALLVLMETV